MKKLASLILVCLATAGIALADTQYFNITASTSTAIISGTKNINAVNLTNGTTITVIIDMVQPGLATNTKVRTVTLATHTNLVTHLNDKSVTNFTMILSTNTPSDVGTDLSQVKADVNYR